MQVARGVNGIVLQPMQRAIPGRSWCKINMLSVKSMTVLHEIHDRFESHLILPYRAVFARSGRGLVGLICILPGNTIGALCHGYGRSCDKW